MWARWKSNQELELPVELPLWHLCMLLLHYAGSFPWCPMCFCSPNIGSHVTLVCPGTHSDPHFSWPFSSGSQHHVTDSMSQYSNFMFQERESDCLALVLSTVVGGGQLESYLLVSWWLRVGQVCMDSEEKIACVWKPIESCQGRAGNDIRKVWSNLIVLHIKKLGLREVKWLL